MGTLDYIALGVSNIGDRKSVVALDYGCFQIRRGEVFGILGSSGSGKSTLMRRIAAQIAADSDHITVSGHHILRNEKTVKRLINRVLADCSLFQKLTPVENLIYGARLYNLGEQKARECALEALKHAGLEEEEICRPMKELDLVAQQKVAKACAALTRPALLLLDEPMAELSFCSKQRIQTLIKELRDIYNATVLLATSDVREVDALCDRVAILDDGKIIALDTPAGLKELVPHACGHEPMLEDVLAALNNKETDD